MNLKFFQRIFVRLLFEYLFKVKVFNQDQSTPKLPIYIKDEKQLSCENTQKVKKQKNCCKYLDSYWLFVRADEMLFTYKK